MKIQTVLKKTTNHIKSWGGGCPKVCVTWFVKGGNSTILPVLLSSRKYGEIKTLHVGHE